MLSYAAIELNSGARFFLQHEHTLSKHGIWLYGSADENPNVQCEEFARAFGIATADIAALSGQAREARRPGYALPGVTRLGAPRRPHNRADHHVGPL